MGVPIPMGVPNNGERPVRRVALKRLIPQIEKEVPTAGSWLANRDPAQRARLKLDTPRAKRLWVWYPVQQQISMHLVELSPSGSQSTKPALATIPPFVVGASNPIPPARGKPQNTFLRGLVFRINEMVQQECEHEVPTRKGDFGSLAVRFGIPTLIELCERGHL
jgi:hypothetical protein